jgi:ribose 5-phosphate isomerase A
LSNEAGKRAAARAAAALVQDNMTVGLGTGSTAKLFLESLGERILRDGLRGVRGVPTSRASEALAHEQNIPIVPLSTDARPDLTVDGADEIGPGLALIKGGGGALVREKLVAASSGEMVVIADRSKVVDVLGAFPLPVAVFPYGWDSTQARLAEAFPGVPLALRRAADGSPFLTDDGLHIVDLRFGSIPDPAGLETRLRAVVGVAEVGLFVNLARRVLIGGEDGNVEDRTR